MEEITKLELYAEITRFVRSRKLIKLRKQLLRYSVPDLAEIRPQPSNVS